MATTDKAQEPTTDVTVLTDDKRFVTVANAQLLEALRENLGDSGGMSKLDLPRLRVPTGGGVAWTIATLDGPDTVKEIDGVILSWGTVRAYWPTAIGEGAGNQPPTCSSADGVHGIGEPGGNCDECPLAAFGTADGGSKAGKACKEARALLVLPLGELMPFYLPAPAMSIKPMKDYFMRLTSAAKPYHSVVTRFKLVQAQNKGGIVYSQIEPSRLRDLDADERAALAQYRDAVVPAFMSAPKLIKADFSGGDS